MSSCLLGRLSCWLLAAALALAGCGSTSNEEAESNPETGDGDEIVVQTDTPEQWAQYQANLRFALDYKARCVSTGQGPRVIVSGYGRFMSNRTNATGEIINRLIPEAVYPLTDPPEPGQVDPPAPQTSVALGTLTLPRSGPVQVCAMILPVAWDLAAALVLKEIQAFNPDLVIMNGIAGSVQPIWLELGSVNRAMAEPDGSSLLAPVEGAPLIPQASSADTLRGLRMSWQSVKSAAEQAIAAEAAVVDGNGQTFASTLTGAQFAGFPRSGNTYLCNNVAYTVNYMMGYPARSVRLMKASTPRPGQPSGISVRLTRDHRQTPRDFIHWPSTLDGANLDAASRVLAAILDAQLSAQQSGDLSSIGSNDIAEVLPSGDTF